MAPAKEYRITKLARRSFIVEDTQGRSFEVLSQIPVSETGLLLGDHVLISGSLGIGSGGSTSDDVVVWKLEPNGQPLEIPLRHNTVPHPYPKIAGQPPPLMSLVTASPKRPWWQFWRRC
jgi:hypothetical protein